MTFGLIRGDALHIPLADESVDLAITSPPYFALRSYQDDGAHYDGQIGSEPTPADFLAALWAVSDELWRVLKPTGSVFLNLGDKYAGSGGHNNSGLHVGEYWKGAGPGWDETRNAPKSYNKARDVPAKSLMGLPWRYALGLICPDTYRTDGGPQWTLRAEVIWDKPNGLPESVQDRVRRSHEQWFHLVKGRQYFSAIDELRVPMGPAGRVETLAQSGPFGTLVGGPPDALTPIEAGPCHECGAFVELFHLADHERADVFVQDERTVGADREHGVGRGATVPLLVEGHPESREDIAALGKDGVGPVVDRDAQMGTPRSAVAQGDRSLSVDDPREPRQFGICRQCHERRLTRRGKLPGSVWTIATEPLVVPADVGVDHFAAFPQEFPRRIILGWSPSGICSSCGEGRRPVVERERVGVTTRGKATTQLRGGGSGGGYALEGAETWQATEATITGYACACDVPIAPTRPAVVLDPFVGTGTVPMVARALGRYGVGLDLSRDYLRLATWRITSGHAHKAINRTNRERQGALW